MNIAEEILKRGFADAQEKERLLRAFKARAIAARSSQPTTWRTRSCPGCGQGLKLKATSGMTILVCAGCSWTAVQPFEMDEARRLGEPFVPGVTGQRRPTVVFAADGSIKRIVG